jgi:hypothetical protein
MLRLTVYLSHTRTQNCFYQGHTATAAAAAELPQKMTQNSWRRGNTEDFCLVGCSSTAVSVHHSIPHDASTTRILPW